MRLICSITLITVVGDIIQMVDRFPGTINDTKFDNIV